MEEKGASAWHGHAPTPLSFVLTALMCLLPTVFDPVVWEPESIWQQQRADEFVSSLFLATVSKVRKCHC